MWITYLGSLTRKRREIWQKSQQGQKKFFNKTKIFVFLKPWRREPKKECTWNVKWMADETNKILVEAERCSLSQGRSYPTSCGIGEKGKIWKDGHHSVVERLSWISSRKGESEVFARSWKSRMRKELGKMNLWKSC